MAANSSTPFPALSPAADGGLHWTAKYRRRLGIGDSVVQLCPHADHWLPPKHGELKINFSISLPDLDPTTGNYLDEPAGFGALARDSKGDLFGFVSGNIKFPSKLAMQIYALRAAANIAKALKVKGIHDGPIVYESNCVMVTINFIKETIFWGNSDPEDCLRAEMPEDLKVVDAIARSRMYVGNPEEMMSVLSPDMRVLVDADKRNAVTPIQPSHQNMVVDEDNKEKIMKTDNKNYEDKGDDCYEIDSTEFRCKLTLESNMEDEVTIVGEKGQVALRDYPHPRHLCANFPFNATPPESYCNKCFCYVCETAAPCLHWTGTSAHCNISKKP